ncbi:MAG: histidyl-tRNA synthetase [Solirubrobacterales bacterium]|jgi:histidyl-tRNA synthetase|nr:histidyl-tRNA synthetase [Solirubrobacterales bacterium]
MAARFKAPRGTFDVLPAESTARTALYRAAARAFELAGYGKIETPAFEETDLFVRGVGESTDIVQKEMFTFEDQGGRSLTLRPEATAAICRAYVEHGMHTLPQPVKLWAWGPFFRHERPQAGRFRQFNQFDAEVIGTDDPIADAEVIMLLDSILREAEVPGVELRLGSLGTPATRAAYREELIAYLRANESELSEEVRARIDQNPLRAFDADHESTRAVMAEAPRMLDRLSDEDSEHFETVKRLLDEAGVVYVLDPSLVRGLDYYTRTVFEFTSDQLGAQSALGGGGRYDGLVAELGGPETPAIGWAAGVERILLALGEHEPGPVLDVFVAAAEGERERALTAVQTLRGAGIRADLDLAGRSIKGQMKQADRTGAGATLILEGGAAKLRDMDTGEEREDELDALLSELRGGS